MDAAYHARNSQALELAMRIAPDRTRAHATGAGLVGVKSPARLYSNENRGF
jgi:hypothetical protein